MLKPVIFFCATAILLAAPLSAMAQMPGQTEITLTDASDEADADKVSSLTDTMANNVRACIRTHQAEALQCLCKFPDDLDRIKIAYDQVLRLHPDWDGKIVSYKKGTEPTTSVSFAGLKTQFETCASVEKAR